MYAGLSNLRLCILPHQNQAQTSKITAN